MKRTFLEPDIEVMNFVSEEMVTTSADTWPWDPDVDEIDPDGVIGNGETIPGFKPGEF